MPLKTLKLLPALLALLAVALPVVAEDEESPLTKQMNVINTAVKKLRKDVKNAELNKASAELAGKCVEAATKCIEMIPSMAAGVPAKDKDKFIEEYKKQMGELIATFKDLEKSLTENKNDEAEKLVEKLLDLKKKGHDKFTE